VVEVEASELIQSGDVELSVVDDGMAFADFELLDTTRKNLCGIVPCGSSVDVVPESRVEIRWKHIRNDTAPVFEARLLDQLHHSFRSRVGCAETLDLKLAENVGDFGVAQEICVPVGTTEN